MKLVLDYPWRVIDVSFEQGDGDNGPLWLRFNDKLVVAVRSGDLYQHDQLTVFSEVLSDQFGIITEMK